MKPLILSILFIALFDTSYAAVLLQKSNFTYNGAFRVPQGNLGGESATFNSLANGSVIALNRSAGTLYIHGKGSEKMITEISIPDPVISENVSSLPTASVVRQPADLTSGNYNKLSVAGTDVANGGFPGGFMLYNNRIIGSAYAYYDQNNGYRSHFAASPTWDANKDFTGLVPLGDPPLYSVVNGGFVGGYMTEIPDEWKERLGGPALTGKGALAVINRSSMGPCAWVFDPDDIGTETPPIQATPVVGYTVEHPTLGTYEGPSMLYNMGVAINGIIFPPGTDSVLFFGRHGLGADGLGTGCYGPGTDDPSEAGRTATSVPNTCHGNVIEGTKVCCYDPVLFDAGNHAYPYVHKVWAYDAHDFQKVVDGDINPETGVAYKPWDIVPYDSWTLDPLPFAQGRYEIRGAAYDPASSTLYITALGETVGYETFPIVHAYTVQVHQRQGTFIFGNSQ